MQFYCVKDKIKVDVPDSKVTYKTRGKTKFAVAKHAKCGTMMWRIVGRVGTKKATKKKITRRKTTTKRGRR